jgi:hypothetical protein
MTTELVQSLYADSALLLKLPPVGGCTLDP